jgi:hypothetical protein
MRACSSAGERLPDVQEAGGSRPSSPTITGNAKAKAACTTMEEQTW